MPGIVVRHGGPTNTRSTDHPVIRVLVDIDCRGYRCCGANSGPVVGTCYPTGS